MKKFDTIVYIGRFQPFHNGHKNTILHAATLAKQVIVIIGSANEPRTFKNPFTVDERELMISKSCLDSNNLLPDGAILTIKSIENSQYNDEAWAVSVQTIVDQNSVGDDIAIIGHNKDESSYYLQMFPQWPFINEQLVEPLDATQIRNIYFSNANNPNWFKGVLPEPVLKYLGLFAIGDAYEQICKERKFIEDYKKQYENLPYPPIFTTVDAVVIQAGHVLMVKRRAEPGKGLLAFPGGFVDARKDKSLEDAMIRELKEETKIDVPEKVIRGSIEKMKVFDAIERSARGRTITHAYYIYFNNGEYALPKVKGGDDAEKAFWIPISQVKRSETFEDHFDILMHFLGR